MRNEDSVGEYEHALDMLRAGSVELCVEKLKKQSKNGDGHADAVLGNIYEFGLGSAPSNPELALDFYQRAIRKCSSLEAIIGSARIKLEGPEALRDISGAIGLLEQIAITESYSPAQVALGYAYLQDDIVRRNLDKAESAFLQAIALGNPAGYGGMANVSQLRGRIFASLYYRIVGGVKGALSPDMTRRW